MKLVPSKDPILSKVLEDIDINNPQVDLKQTKQDMVELMVSKRGLGLAACQVGLDYKIFIIGENKENCMMFVNPEVISVSEETELDVEGCLSYPDVFVKMPRPQDVSYMSLTTYMVLYIKTKYLDSNGIELSKRNQKLQSNVTN
jgi:peptide deformylase